MADEYGRTGRAYFFMGSRKGIFISFIFQSGFYRYDGSRVPDLLLYSDYAQADVTIING